MGLKKYFQPPEPETREENNANLVTLGVPVKNLTRKSKNRFSHFNLYSKLKREQTLDKYKPVPVSVRTPEIVETPSTFPQTPTSPLVSKPNPYAAYEFEATDEKYPTDSGKSSNDYSDGYPSSELLSKSAYGTYSRSVSAPTTDNEYQNKYPSTELTSTPPISPLFSNSRSFSRYSNGNSTFSPSASHHTQDTVDQDYTRKPSISHDWSQLYEVEQQQEEEEDLNAMPQYEESVVDLNLVPEEYVDNTFLEEEQLREQLRLEQEQEDEDVDRIKQDIRFTKQASVASTRNTMRMASEAEVSGQNTLGMLGAQSEKLYEIERDMLLAKTQNQIATDKVKEMAKIDRSFMLVHVTNPFNTKRKLQLQENKIRNQMKEDKLIQQKLRSQQYRTEMNLVSGIKEAEGGETGEEAESSRLFLTDKERLEESKKFQFENDKEDDEMELEISKNLDAIENSTRRLNRMANVIGNEMESQQKRWKKVENDADHLDMEVHLNNHRLAGVMK